MSVLTTKDYWRRIPNNTKSYWMNLSNHFIYTDAIICTHRPSLREFKKSKGGQLIRRCSTNGRYGKRADLVLLDLKKLLKSGFVLINEF